MSRRRMKALTRIGRQVSEDPDLDNLLSTLSPEEVEELQQDMMKVPDLKPEDDKVLAQGRAKLRRRLRATTTVNWTAGERVTGDTKKESRKQEYLRKMGLSQEGNDDVTVGLRRQASVSGEKDIKVEDRNSKGPGNSNEERSRLSSRYRKQESRESDVKEDSEKQEDNKIRDRRDNRESTGSKTKDMISKLQEKKDDSKDRKEDCRRKDESKTKDIISKLREKQEKEVGKEKDRRSEGFRTSGLVSKIARPKKAWLRRKPEEKKPKAEEKKAEDTKKPEVKLERQASEKGEVQVKHDKAENRTDREELVNHIEKAEESEKLGNCVAKNSPISKAKEEEEEEEDSSMFDELMEQVRSNDPSLTELNVNNSEVIKTKTLIEFAEALHKNTNIKKFALANCRADDHVAYAISGTLRNNKTITSINVDSNHLTGKGILSLIQALPHNATLTELRFQNQRHICGGKTEMEMTKILKENFTLLKLGYHFELAGPRMTTTNILSRNMDRQRQKRLQEQKLAQANGEKKGALEVPKTGGGGSLRNSPRASPKPSPIPSPMPSPKLTPKRGAGGGAPPPPTPPPGGGPPPPPPPMLNVDALRNSLTPVSQRKLDGKSPGGSENTRDQLLASIRGNTKKQLKKVRGSAKVVAMIFPLECAMKGKKEGGVVFNMNSTPSRCS
ncbi:hypothetical protein F7725_017299 [Dissostichus mawsoni]|uniref:Leiomodin-1 n=1 Tax=Dissostichus mawsoni TaxID=36200 RepID=A0A7J5Z4Q7_DISMA|nr:hypothetical protein F7725_017299 [Dissostichus mawsoni]